MIIKNYSVLIQVLSCLVIFHKFRWLKVKISKSRAAFNARLTTSSKPRGKEGKQLETWVLADLLPVSSYEKGEKNKTQSKQTKIQPPGSFHMHFWYPCNINLQMKSKAVWERCLIASFILNWLVGVEKAKQKNKKTAPPLNPTACVSRPAGGAPSLYFGLISPRQQVSFNNDYILATRRKKIMKRPMHFLPRGCYFFQYNWNMFP